MLVALNRTYQLYKSASEYFRFPYDMSVAPLINGYFTAKTVNAEMPSSGRPNEAMIARLAKSSKIIRESYSRPLSRTIWC
jgi:hypothetical protein